MRVLLFTSNAYRHKHVANKIVANGNQLLVVSEAKEAEYLVIGDTPLKAEHFRLRFEVESELLKDDAILKADSFPIRYGEVNSTYVASLCRSWKPDIIVCFGGSLLKEEILGLREVTTTGYFINLHLGLSPYYRGSGTNFWPFVNDELEYVGSTIHHIDLGIDTGNIIAHVTPDFTSDDTVHTVGSNVIRKSAEKIVELIEQVQGGAKLDGVPQWKSEFERVYKIKDFTDEALKRYHMNLQHGMIQRFIESGRQKYPKLIL